MEWLLYIGAGIFGAVQVLLIRAAFSKSRPVASVSDQLVGLIRDKDEALYRIARMLKSGSLQELAVAEAAETPAVFAGRPITDQEESEIENERMERAFVEALKANDAPPAENLVLTRPSSLPVGMAEAIGAPE